MAKNDYHLIVYKILLYYYACLKREAVFNEAVLIKEIGDVEENYLEDVIRNLVIEGYVRGLYFAKAWETTYIRITDLEYGEITQKGIEFLKENSQMQKVKEFLLETASPIASLIKLVFGMK